MRCAGILVTLIASGALLAPALAAAAGCRATTGAQTNVLVELFTSEGCSSCPPADRWLSALGRKTAGAGRVVPIAWHVDYWDYIGWKDRFAQPAFSARQRSLAQTRREPVVYTPQVLVQGRDFRRWPEGGFDALVEGLQAGAARARIALSITGRTAAALEIEAHAELLGEAARAAPGDYALVLAATASGFGTTVRAGENAGRRLAHDHVAFGWRGPIAFGRDGALALKGRLTLPSAAPDGAGVVAFVQSTRSAEVLQALVLPVCPG
ncbi:MAG: hypothetical protein AMJ64_04465 [Betaproteobacteria bacterium SG8_39]|nr:MAG: hypothetical protein AMJ64_04465 [Betaproteobacteria bacterium SG8_39]